MPTGYEMLRSARTEAALESDHHAEKATEWLKGTMSNVALAQVHATLAVSFQLKAMRLDEEARDAIRGL